MSVVRKKERRCMYHNYYSNNELLGNSLRLEIVAGEPVRHVDVVLYRELNRCCIV